MPKWFVLIGVVTCVPGAATSGAERPATPPAASGFTPRAQQTIVASDARPELLWAEGQFTEGGAAAPDGTILFSDIGNRILQYHPRTGRTTVFRQPSGRANGMAFDTEGRLLVCEGANRGGNRRVSVSRRSGPARTLADRWNGKRLNSPNDLCVDRQGRVYFTDPRYVGDEPREIDFEGIFRIDPDGRVVMVSQELSKPNGIQLSPDGQFLYVVDHDPRPAGRRQIVRFRVASDGSLSARRVLFDSGSNRGMDGMTTDIDGNLYAAGGTGDQAGIYVFGPAGEHLAWIALPGDPTNCCFGRGKFARTLFVTAQAPLEESRADPRSYGLYRIELRKRGFHLRS